MHGLPIDQGKLLRQQSRRQYQNQEKQNPFDRVQQPHPGWSRGYLTILGHIALRHCRASPAATRTGTVEALISLSPRITAAST